jgi:hypothetical protein
MQGFIGLQLCQQLGTVVRFMFGDHVKVFLTEVFLFLIVGSAIGAVVEIISMEPYR